MNVSTLANQMNVTESDINSLLRMVSTSMSQDGMTNNFLAMSEAERVEVVNAYVKAEVKKFNEFCVTLLTNTEKKSAFDQYILFKLKN
jgi:hypothetical protein